MTPEEALRRLQDSIAVTNQMVTYAKSFIVKNFDSDTRGLLDALLQNVEAPVPRTIVIHPSVDTAPMLRQAASAISWRLAGCEAVWGLIFGGLLIPATNELVEADRHLAWTTAVSGSGGSSSGWHLGGLCLPVPARILRPFSSAVGTNQPLSDPDLYLHELAIENLHKEVQESLRESVKCFKHDLYLGCLVLLGRASEGAWIELGLSLANAVPDGASIDGTRYAATFEDPFVGVGKKIKKVLELYDRKDVFGPIYKASGYGIRDLRNAVIWADAVRESRNSVHYRVQPSMSNSYEKVAALLIGAVPHLKILYAIIGAAQKERKA